MSVCDLCNIPIGPEATRYTASQIKTAAQKGLRPPKALDAIGLAFGISPQAQEADWVRQVMADTTDWLLCSSCSQKANRYL